MFGENNTAARILGKEQTPKLLNELVSLQKDLQKVREERQGGSSVRDRSKEEAKRESQEESKIRGGESGLKKGQR